jgi:hypothetical protein
MIALAVERLSAGPARAPCVAEAVVSRRAVRRMKFIAVAAPWQGSVLPAR